MRALLLLVLATLAGAADEWPQFRGNPQLTGVAAGAVPDNLRLLWTYEAGEAVDSSAAISGGVVYAGVQSGDLVAIDLGSGKLRWKYRVQDGIESSSPAIHDGVVYIGDLAGLLHAVGAADGKPRWTFKTDAEIKSSPVPLGDRVLIGSYDGNLYCLSAAGKLLWKFTTENYVHSTPGIWEGVAYFGGCDEAFHGIRIADGKEVLQFPAGGYTAASPAMAGQWAYFGTFSDNVEGVHLRRKRIAWTYEHPDRHFPFYSSAAVTGDRLVVGGRDKMVHCLNLKTGKAVLDVCDTLPRRFFAGDRRGARLRGLRRRSFLRAGLDHGEKALGFRSRLAAHGLARHRRRARGDRLRRRASVLLRAVAGPVGAVKKIIISRR